MRSSFELLRPADAAAALAAALPPLLGSGLAVTPAFVPVITARLFCGDFEDVRRLVLDADPGAALPLIAARYHAWSGDLSTLLHVFDRVHASIDLAQAQGGMAAASWAEVERAATDAGDPALAARLARLAREAPAPVSRNPRDEGAADVVLRIAHGLLGVEPDAHRGRIRLRPRLIGLDALEVRELRFGDGAVSLCVVRGTDRITCTIEQEAGAMPFTALLEPVVERAAEATVDGVVAQLDVRLWEGGSMAPVQLVLDAPRTLELFVQKRESRPPE